MNLHEIPVSIIINFVGSVAPSLLPVSNWISKRGAKYFASLQFTDFIGFTRIDGEEVRRLAEESSRLIYR
jgi:hypothetical protein